MKRRSLMTPHLSGWDKMSIVVLLFLVEDKTLM